MNLKPLKRLKEIKTEKLITGDVRITHHQSLKQSFDWQSIECSYGVSFEVSPGHIHEGMRLSESMVESAIAKKYLEQQKLLQVMAEKKKESARE